MKKLIFILFILPLISLSQGFDWQYSARLPQDYPRLFAGLKSQYSLSSHFGEFHLIEELIQCCKFETGTGIDFSLGFIIEYWIDDSKSIGGNISFHSIKADFSSQKSFPKVNYNLVTDYKVNSNINYVDFNFSLKNRILESFFFCTSSIDFSILLSSKMKFSELKNPITPSSDQFKDRIDIQNGRVEDLRSILITPSIGFGYDFGIMKDIYLSSQVSFGIPVMSIISNESWKKYSFGIGISLFRTIK